MRTMIVTTGAVILALLAAGCGLFGGDDPQARACATARELLATATDMAVVACAADLFETEDCRKAQLAATIADGLVARRCVAPVGAAG